MNLVGNIAASSQLKLTEELIVHYFELSGKIDFSVYLLIKFIFLKIRQKKFFGYNLFYYLYTFYRCSTRSLISAVRPWFQNWVPM